MNSDRLESIRQRVLSAFKAGQLSSYDRQPPRGEVLENLAVAKSETEALLADGQTSPEVYRLLALVQESLTQYATAARTLETLVANKTATRDDLKRLAMCRIAAAKRAAAPSGDP